MNDNSYCYEYFLLFSRVARQHTIGFLETFGKVAGGSKTYVIGYLADTLIGSDQQLIGSVEASGTQQFNR